MTLTGIPLNYALHASTDPRTTWRTAAIDVEVIVRLLAGAPDAGRRRLRRTGA